ncbi:LysE family translocator (plasmid) [Agrobacterium leguminum]|uniref:Threonine efflux protein n=1 Tax=Agrobacterium deltaense NCPPB 1641 TaxID=1183425 RepID=A0A1S7UA20_9HYPH|nr:MULTISPECIES: LysE family translocator [Agrobacterium]WFS69638.1 LysE family translocator [Agrobacterium leguminum]CVI63652.1 putative threonine efflux protein [Agrobacterium deltaense NCPPB 1641]
MTYTDNLWVYFTLLLGIMLVPGLDMLFVLASSLTGGKQVGMSAMSGIVAGGVVHSLYGAIGVGLLANLIPALFTPLLVFGAIYMVWIGLSLIRSSIVIKGDEVSVSASAWQAFRRGMVTSLSNPKAYLFLTAVYPQFMKPAYGPVWIQGIIMGLMAAGTQIAVYGSVVLTAATSRDWLISSPKVTIVIGRSAGLLLVVVASFTLWKGLQGR